MVLRVVKATLVALAACGTLGALWGCGDETGGDAGAASPPRPAAPGWQIALERQAGLQLPPGVELLRSDDGGGRNPGFYLWLLYSPTEFELPTTATTPEDGRRLVHVYSPTESELRTTEEDELMAALMNYMNSDPSVRATEAVEPYLPRGHELGQVLGGSTPSWKTAHGEYRTHVLQTERGHYLLIEQFRLPAK